MLLLVVAAAAAVVVGGAAKRRRAAKQQNETRQGSDLHERQVLPELRVEHTPVCCGGHGPKPPRAEVWR
jgi:hypothetical protein